MAKQEYDNNNSGALFKNDKKTTDKHPDYRGQAEVDGVEYWVSAWIKKSKDGKAYMSLSFSEKEEESGGGRPAGSSGSTGGQRPAPKKDDGDIPF